MHHDLTGQDNNHRLFSVTEAADYLGLSKSFLDKARISGDGPPFLKLGSRVLYQSGTLQSWLLFRQRTSTSDQCTGDTSAVAISRPIMNSPSTTWRTQAAARCHGCRRREEQRRMPRGLQQAQPDWRSPM